MYPINENSQKQIQPSFGFIQQQFQGNGKENSLIMSKNPGHQRILSSEDLLTETSDYNRTLSQDEGTSRTNGAPVSDENTWVYDQTNVDELRADIQNQ